MKVVKLTDNQNTRIQKTNGLPLLKSIEKHAYTQRSARNKKQGILIPISKKEVYLTPRDVSSQYKSIDTFIQTLDEAETSLQRPIVASLSILEKQSIVKGDSVQPLDYVNMYAEEQFINIQAYKIQQTWRTYRFRCRSRTFLRLRLRYVRRLSLFLLTVWRLYTAKNSILSHELFDRILTDSQNFPFFTVGRNPSSYRYFYLSGLLYVPVLFSSQELVKVCASFIRPIAKKILNEWKVLARQRVTRKKAMGFWKQTLNKTGYYGIYLKCFHFWWNITRFKKLKAKTTPLEQPEIFLNPHDSFLGWYIWEKNYNKKRRDQSRAERNRIEVIILNVLNALHNNMNKNKRRERSRVYLARLSLMNTFKLGMRAWKHQRAQSVHYNNMLHVIIKSWYQWAYRRSKSHTFIKIYQNRENQFHLHKIMSRWSFVARRMALKGLFDICNHQKYPTLTMQVIYLLQGRLDEYFFLMAFRQWIKFGRARRAWKMFMKWSKVLPVDHDLKYNILSQFRRYPGRREGIFSRGLGLSLDLELNTLHTVIEPRLLLSFKEKHNEIMKSDKENFRESDALVRAFHMFIHKKKDFETFPLPLEDTFERYRNEDEIMEQVQKNRYIYKKNLVSKCKRDNALLLSINAHCSSIDLSHINPSYTTAIEASLLSVPEVTSDQSLRVEVYEEVQESIDALIEMLDNSPPRQVSNLFAIRDEAFSEFKKRIRTPKKIEEDTPVRRLLTHATSQTLNNEQLMHLLAVEGFECKPCVPVPEHSETHIRENHVQIGTQTDIELSVQAPAPLARDSLLANNPRKNLKYVTSTEHDNTEPGSINGSNGDAPSTLVENEVDINNEHHGLTDSTPDENPYRCDTNNICSYDAGSVEEIAEKFVSSAINEILLKTIRNAYVYENTDETVAESHVLTKQSGVTNEEMSPKIEEQSENPSNDLTSNGVLQEDVTDQDDNPTDILQPVEPDMDSTNRAPRKV